MRIAPIETFSRLSEESWLRHGFIQRVPGLELEMEREEALALLAEPHNSAIARIGLGNRRMITAEQVHGSRVTRVSKETESPVLNCDGLLTNDPEISLGIYVADCGAIYLADPVHRAIGLLHSGKKGTALEILSMAIQQMTKEFGSNPGMLVVQLAPCIRPPDYEVDFADAIAGQARAAGVGHFVDCEKNTAANLNHYYSYRRELGKTGRHLAVLGYEN